MIEYGRQVFILDVNKEKKAILLHIQYCTLGRSDFEKKSCPINLNRDSSNFAQKAIKCDLNKFIHPIPIQLTFDADTRNLPYNVQPFSNISAKECLYSDTLILISFQLLTFPP